MTTDNASPNTVMANHLSCLVPLFDGSTSLVGCFDHTVNLVSKTILKLFNSWAPMVADNGNDGEDGEDIADNDDGEEDNVEGWVNELDNMGKEEQETLKVAVEPVKKVLVKV
jgi:hypothetical protein